MVYIHTHQDRIESRCVITSGLQRVLTDKSVVFVLNEESLSTALARDLLAFLIKESGNEYGSVLLPVQIIIDSGHYLRADK